MTWSRINRMRGQERVPIELKNQYMRGFRVLVDSRKFPPRAVTRGERRTDEGAKEYFL